MVTTVAVPEATLIIVFATILPSKLECGDTCQMRKGSLAGKLYFNDFESGEN